MIGKFGKIIQIAWETIIKWSFISLLFAVESSCARMDLNNPSRVGDNSFLAIQGLRCVFGQDSVFCPATGTGTATGTATGTVSDTTPPTVSSISPANSTTGVSVTNSISVTFSESMNVSTLTTQSSDGTCSGSFQVSADSFTTCVGGTLTTNGNPTFTFSANPNLCVGNSYKVKITTAAKDLAGNALTADSTSTGFSTQNPIVGTGAAGSWVMSMALSCNTMYFGGNFVTFGGQAKNYAAAVDLTTGNTTSWNPNVGSQVTVVAVSGSTVYLGGAFTLINGGITRNYIAAVDGTTGTVTPFNPNGSGGTGVNAIVVNGNIVYVGGGFGNIGGQAMTNIAALDATTGLATSWNPGNTGAAVFNLALSGTTLFVSGSFAMLGGTARNRIGSLDTSTAALNSWNPNVSAGSIVNSVYLSDSGVFVLGDFTTIGGQTRTDFAEADYSTGAVSPTSLNLNMAGTDAKTLAKNGNTLFVGGQYTNIGGQPRNHLAAIDYSTGFATSWNPNPSNFIYNVKISGNVLYVSGAFSTIAGQPRSGIAAFDLNTLSLLP